MMCLLAIASGMPLRAESPTPEHIEFFESKVRPILVEHCYECHSVQGDTIEAGSAYIGAAVDAETVTRRIVGDDKQNVWPLFGRLGGGRHQHEKNK